MNPALSLPHLTAPMIFGAARCIVSDPRKGVWRANLSDDGAN